MLDMDEELRRRLLTEQKNEITGHIIYGRLAEIIKDQKNTEILEKISQDEKDHYDFLKDLTGEEVSPNNFIIQWYLLLACILGLTFVMKLLERDEEDAQEIYGVLQEDVEGVSQMLQDEEKHENELIGMIDETRLDYIGSIVLGLNDALVELTGTLAGLSFAFQDTNLIALSGLITGIAASMSMGASEYLSTRAEDGENAIRAALYTGLSYVITVVFLVLPFFVFQRYLVSLPVTLMIAVVIILLFNYYVSVAKDLNFRKQFTEMASISLGVSGLSFLVGVLVKTFLGVEV
ncbi:rubrerythrin family protein [Candidatus Bathyarchaeota archaeon]|nr:rubrerythrin family protein [Candidatus Bathyarchaeota archaeon]